MFYTSYVDVSLTTYYRSIEATRADCGSLRSTMRRRVLSDPQKELQSIITHLEEENKQLQIELLDIQGSKAERLQHHRAMIESQLQRLKLLKVYYCLVKYNGISIRKIIVLLFTEILVLG